MSKRLSPIRRLERFLASERGKRILNYFYSWGAAFVILGALFKLLHIRYGDEILLVSMLCLLYTSPSPRDPKTSRMPSSA